ncbi:hypothetical protein K9M79_02780 [Candidatus Woesearchaeota archaeon]|nr:hypothetical protein [Candidatus Woesearchaeota archaeon]
MAIRNSSKRTHLNKSNRKDSRRAIWNYSISIFMILIAFIVLLIITGKFSEIYYDIAGSTTCTWSFLTASITKIPPECKMKMLEFSEKDLTTEEMKLYVTEQFKRFNCQGYYNTDDCTQKYSTVSFSGNLDEKGQMNDKMKEYALDKLMADEIKGCWDMVGHGKVAAFERYWSYMKCPDGDGGYRGCTKTEIVKQLGLASLGEPTSVVQNPPRMCIICSRIKFDDSLKAKFTGRVESLKEMMMYTPVSTVDMKSYYQYVIENDDLNKGIYASEFKYSTDQPYAVVYSRINKEILVEIASQTTNFDGLGILKAVGVAAGIPGKLEGDLNAVYLIPYNEEVKKHCSYIMNY